MKPVRKTEFVIGVVFLAIAIFIFFGLPKAALYQGGRRSFGEVIQGISVIFGESGARYFAALPFAVFAWIAMRDAWKPWAPKPNSQLHTDAKDDGEPRR